jgi:hypothetical protein
MNAGKSLVPSIVFGLWAFGAGAANVSLVDAPNHVGESATVCGVVASAKFA